MPTSPDLRHHQPLAGRSPRERRRLYADSTMHSPNADVRAEADAFEIRGDVTVEDACVTALRLTRAAVAQLELLGMTPELAPAYRDAVEGIACLCRLSGGSIGLVHAALCDQPPPAGSFG